MSVQHPNSDELMQIEPQISVKSEIIRESTHLSDKRVDDCSPSVKNEVESMSLSKATPETVMQNMLIPFSESEPIPIDVSNGSSTKCDEFVDLFSHLANDSLVASK